MTEAQTGQQIPSTSAVNRQGTQTACPLTAVSAIHFANTFLGPDRVWQGDTEAQRHFIAQYLVPFGVVANSLSEVSSIAAPDAATINDFLRRHGFTIELSRLGEHEMGVASVLDVLCEWDVRGIRSELFGGNGNKFQSFDLSPSIVSFHRSPISPEPVVCVCTKTGDRVYLGMIEPRPDLGLFETARQISTVESRLNDWDGARVPMVSLRHQPDISFLLGLETIDEQKCRWVITQALQENRLRMNDEGVRAQSATAIGMTRGMGPREPKPIFVIARPFMITIERRGVNLPLFAAYVDYSDWRDPGSIRD